VEGNGPEWYSVAEILCSAFFTVNKHVDGTAVRHWRGGYAVVQLVEAPRYKPEGRGLDS
jgi:hypothetical protein